jgi:hypothetical protein
MSTITKTKPKIRTDFKVQIEELGQVTIHFLVFTPFPMGIRIWESTYLYDVGSSHRSSLIYAHNINVYPTHGSWIEIGPGSYEFTLVFEGLPSGCSTFDMIEDCKGESGSLSIKGIQRNKQDVYYVQF